MQATRKIKIGPAGWSYKDWEGIFYPPGMQHRKQHPLDILARCIDRPLADVEPGVLDLLRLGAYQALRTRIPPHAAATSTAAVRARSPGTLERRQDMERNSLMDSGLG